MGYVALYWFIIIVINTFLGIVWGYATKTIVNNKGYSDNWFWWGFFFGIIALLVALTKPDINQNVRSSGYSSIKYDTWTCPACSRVNQSYVITCECGAVKANTSNSFKVATAQESVPSISSADEKKKLLPVRNYYPGFPAKILSLRLSPLGNEALPIEFVCQFYDEDITAIRVEILLMDIWGEKKSFPEIDLQIPQGTKGKITLTHTIHMSADKVATIQSANVIIDRILIRFEILKNETPSVDILFPDQELYRIRAKMGEDAVAKAEINSFNWTCICGAHNDITLDYCQLCKRRQSVANGSDVLDMNLILQKAEDMGSLKEIYTFLTTYKEATSSEAFLSLLKDLEYNVDIERMYGNMKSTAVKRLNKYREKIDGSL